MNEVEPKPEPSLTTLDALVERYQLENDGKMINAGDEYRFIKMERHERARLPNEIPCMPGVTEDGDLVMLGLVPADFIDRRPRADTMPNEPPKPTRRSRTKRTPRDVPNDMLRSVKVELLRLDEIFIPNEMDFPDDDVINDEIFQYGERCKFEVAADEATSELHSFECQLAGAADVKGPTPMLIDGLMRERGVSVVYGDFDEFKTTLALDWAAHIAYGLPWQNRDVVGRPVVWYALEGDDEITERVKALQANLNNGEGSTWGEGHAPIMTRMHLPDSYEVWRDDIQDVWSSFANQHRIRVDRNLTPSTCELDGYTGYGKTIIPGMVVVIDTLSMALGGHDEKGPKAVEFINNCLNLYKPSPGDDEDEWGFSPPVDHVIIIHHQTKTGIDFGGHRAIAANTSGLYRVFRYGKREDVDRSMAFALQAIRTKGMLRPPMMRLEAEVANVPGADRETVIVKDKAAAVPERLMPIIEALRELEDNQEITRDDLNNCLDRASKAKGGALRTARSRNRDDLEKAGVLEPVEDENGKVKFHRFHDQV